MLTFLIVWNSDTLLIAGMYSQWLGTVWKAAVGIPLGNLPVQAANTFVLIYVIMCQVDDPWCKAETCRPSVDATFQDGSWIESQSLLPVMVADHLILYNNTEILYWLQDLQPQILLLLY